MCLLMFLVCVHSFQALPKLNVIQAISLFVQFVPLEGEVHDFFRPVTSQILQLLKGSQCLPTDHIESDRSTSSNLFNKIKTVCGGNCADLEYEEELEVMWKQPSQLVMVAHDFIRDYIPQFVLANSLNLYYLHPSLVTRVSPDLCMHLGIGTMTVDHLIAVANSVLDSYHNGEDFESDSCSSLDYNDSMSDGETAVSSFECLASWIAYWLACVYTVLEESGRNVSTQTLASLKKLKIIPLMDETLVSLSEGAIFFPPNSDTGKYLGFWILLFLC